MSTRRRPSNLPSGPLAAACFSAAFWSACAGGGHPSTGDEASSTKSRITAPAASSDDLATLAADNRRFAVDVYQALRATPGNLIFSPESISLALAMTYGGAAGNTALQMATALRFSLPPDRLHPAFDALDLALTSRGAGGQAGAFQLQLANSLWTQTGFTLLPSYLDLLAQNYGAAAHLVDFINATEAARADINQWVSDQTSGKIPDLLQPGAIDMTTRLVLANAVYFKADWATPFDPQSPDGTFTTLTGTVTVPMMHGPENISLWKGAGYQAASVPYVGNTTSMVVIVPDAGTFDAFEAALTGDVLDGILAAPSAVSGGLSMPKFKLKEALSLRGVLSGLGMTDAFDPTLADFSGMDGARDLFVGDVIHQALIAVDEKGTEAAAATAVVVVTSAAILNNLFVNRPFLFLIRDDATSSILFLGRVVDPSM
jgi:serpin B